MRISVSSMNGIPYIKMKKGIGAILSNLDPSFRRDGSLPSFRFIHGPSTFTWLVDDK
jgi:hypothetical protein